MELIPDNDPRLTEPSTPINPRQPGIDLPQILEDMISLMVEKQGVGLAAPQVGINRRFFVLRVEGRIYTCINPKVIKASSVLQTVKEGCLSFPGLEVPVQRPTVIKVEYQEASGLKRTKTFKGILARAFLHELDHLNGTVLPHYVEKKDGIVKRRGQPL